MKMFPCVYCGRHPDRHIEVRLPFDSLPFLTCYGGVGMVYTPPPRRLPIRGVGGARMQIGRWICQESGWWTSELGGICLERGGWYWYPADAPDDERRGPFRTLRKAIMYAEPTCA